MKTIIAGTRTIYDPQTIKDAVSQIDWEITEVISGGAAGVDRLGEDYALTNALDLVIFPANWQKHGKAAGAIRNGRMADYADALIAIWDGQSKGTQNMIDSMLERAKPVKVYIPRDSL